MARLEERVGTIRTPVSTPRIPRWLLYSGIGTAAIGTLVAGYFGLRSLGVPLPPQPRQAEQQQEQQYTQPQNGSEVKPQIPGIENVMSQQQLASTLEEVFSYRRNFNPTIEGSWETATPEDLTIWKKVEQTNKTLYFMLTGRTFEQDQFVIRIVRLDEQVPNVVSEWRTPDGTLGEAGTVAQLGDGTIEIYALGVPNMYADSSRILVLLLANETGNALGRRLESQGKGLDGAVLPRNNSEYWKVVPLEKRLGEFDSTVWREAAKSLYQAAALHLMEDLGIKGITIADTQINRDQLRLGMERAAQTSQVDHEGFYLGWLYALNDEQAKEELEASGRLSVKTAMRLHNKILASVYNPNLKGIVQEVLKPETKAVLQPQILGASYKRLMLNGAIGLIRPGDTFYLLPP